MIKKRINIGAITANRGLWIAISMIITGGVAVAFFGLVLIGFAISPNLLGELPSAVVTLVIFAGSIMLVHRGVRGIKQYRSGKAWAEDKSPPPATAWETAPQRAAITIACASCGATTEDDGSGCCEYCGSPLQKNEE